jgi:hypothetical protein
MRAVEAVLTPQPVPVHGRLHVALVLDVDEDLGALCDPERRAGDGAIVGEHPHGHMADALGDRGDGQREVVAAGKLDS